MTSPLLGASAPSRPDPPLLLVGTDFRCAPIELRERVALGKEEAEKTLVHLLARPEIAEAFLLSTCNRTELYLQPRDEDRAYQAALELVFLAREPELERPGRLYVQAQRRGGPPSAGGGGRAGVDGARRARDPGPGQGRGGPGRGRRAPRGRCSSACCAAPSRPAGGRARRRRSPPARSRSATRSWSWRGSIFSGLDDCRVLLIGAGEIARSVARPLIERGARELRVANRGGERARQFQEEFANAELIAFEDRLEAVRTADLVIASTGAEEPVLTRRQLAEAMRSRPSRPLLVVDLGVPRNVEPAAGRAENVFLHTIDSLDHLIQRNLKRRREELPRAEEIVEQELAHFRAWFRGLEAEPLVARMQKQAERIRLQELAEVLPRFPEETHAELERLTRSLVRKILHHPSSRLRATRRRGRPLPARPRARALPSR